MFGIGMPEMILILAVALIVIGPKKLPDLAKSLGKAMGEFKKATRDLKDSIQIDDEIKDMKRTFDELDDDIKGKPAAASNKSQEKSRETEKPADPVTAKQAESGEDPAAGDQGADEGAPSDPSQIISDPDEQPEKG